MGAEPGANRFLIVEDDELVARAFAACMRRFGATRVVGTIGDARRALASCTWSGVVLDVSLPDGTGLELLARLRREGSALPALVVTGTHDAVVANQCHQLDAVCVFKPDVSPNLDLFAMRALAHAGGRDARTAAALASLRRTRQLSPREVQIAQLVASGVPRRGLAERVGVTENTMKTMVRSLLTKLGADSVEEVARVVLEEIIRLTDLERA